MLRCYESRYEACDIRFDAGSPVSQCLGFYLPRSRCVKERGLETDEERREPGPKTLSAHICPRYTIRGRFQIIVELCAYEVSSFGRSHFGDCRNHSDIATNKISTPSSMLSSRYACYVWKKTCRYPIIQAFTQNDSLLYTNVVTNAIRSRLSSDLYPLAVVCCYIS